MESARPTMVPSARERCGAGYDRTVVGCCGVQLASDARSAPGFPQLVREGRLDCRDISSPTALLGAWCGSATTIRGSITYLDHARVGGHADTRARLWSCPSVHAACWSATQRISPSRSP